MNTDPSEVLVKVLDLIGYTEDKQEFANKFLDTCKKQAMSDLIASLPPDKLQSLESELETANNDPDQIKTISMKYFTEDEYTKALQKTTEDLFKDFLNSTAPQLNDDQKNALQSYLDTIKN